jgi:hypothetical protein
MLLHNYFVMIGFDSKFKGIQKPLLKRSLEICLGKEKGKHLSPSSPLKFDPLAHPAEPAHAPPRRPAGPSSLLSLMFSSWAGPKWSLATAATPSLPLYHR